MSTAAPAPALEAHELTRRFGGFTAVDRITFDAAGGAKVVDRWTIGKRIRDVEEAPDGSLWLGGWCGVDCRLFAIVEPWNDPGNTTQFVPADHMNVATRT